MELKPVQIDAIKELVNIGIGRAAGTLNAMVKSPIKLEVPTVKVMTPKEVESELENLRSGHLASVSLKFSGPFSGLGELVFPTDSASKLVSVLTESDPALDDMDSIRMGVISEVGNILKPLKKSPKVLPFFSKRSVTQS